VPDDVLLKAKVSAMEINPIGVRKMRLLLVPPLLLLAAFASGCVRNTPVTGRKQVLLMPESHEVALGVAAYREILENETLSTNSQYVELVNRVGKRIANATGEQYDWEFKVIASDVQNAFCLPGGKVAIYEGILPICQTEAGLAVVMSHEVAHAVARHGGERLSQGAMANGAKKAVAWVTQDLDQTNREITLAAFGAATEVGFILPYSRKHESEADSMGMIYMAKAGYDPSEAPRFWKRFAEATAGGEVTPEFLSTHPADERRSQDLAAQLPAALELYRAAPAQYGLGQTIPARGNSLAHQRPADWQNVQRAAHFTPAAELQNGHFMQRSSANGLSASGSTSNLVPLGIQSCLNGQCNHQHHGAPARNAATPDPFQPGVPDENLPPFAPADPSNLPGNLPLVR
jgi:metalloendopeptidase OMA1, mitochondrial